MMIQKKIAGAFLIFLILLIVAWRLEHKTQRIIVKPTNISHQVHDTLPINTLISPINEQYLEEFKAREYVRILRVFNEKP